MANEFARSLRKYPTNAERKLWARLRQKQFGGFRFRRQQPIGSYVADFFCARAKLIVELDGGQHGKDSHAIRDEVRTRWLDSQGYRVLRFWNNEVIQNLNGVLEGIEIALGAAPHPSRNCGSTSLSRGRRNSEAPFSSSRFTLEEGGGTFGLSGTADPRSFSRWRLPSKFCPLLGSGRVTLGPNAHRLHHLP
jgi:very-short-patch-repair endonuclease